MSRPPLPEHLRRSESARASLRVCEAALIAEMAEQDDITPSEWVYMAILEKLIRERPEACSASGIRMPVLVG